MEVLLVDDHSLVREGLSLLLQALNPQVEVLQASNGLEGLVQFDRHPGMELALVDLAMPDMDGFDLLAELSGRQTKCRLVVISATDDNRHIARAQANGAHGFIHKSWSSAQMLDTLKQVLEGEPAWPPGVASEASPQLTSRQQDILQSLAHGSANRQIADELYISEHTVKFHLTTLYRLLDATNRTECVAQARSMGLLA